MPELYEKPPPLFAEIIIPLALPKNYTWEVPEEWQAKALPGVRAEVMLGKTKKYAGIIKRTFHEDPGFGTKPLLNLLDDQPVVTAQQLAFWEWMAGYYLCTEGDVMQAALPQHLKLSSETIVSYNEDFEGDLAELEERQFLVAEALQMRKELRLSEVQQILDARQVYPVIKTLIERGIAFVWEELKQKYQAKTENFVLLHPQHQGSEALEKLMNQPMKAAKQMELLLAYLTLMKQGEVSQPELLKKSGGTAAQLKALVDKEVLVLQKRRVDRLQQMPPTINLNFELSAAQALALSQVQQGLADKHFCLLHGVTASGKTQLYIHLIAQVLQQGGQVLYMLPEIALTAQVIRRLQAHLGGNIAIYHSKFNPNERLELWNKIRSGEVRAVLGARSSIFLPFHNLKLIIVDEEHDGSYKQGEPAPRYHARDSALYLAGQCGAQVLLGSATPSLETYYNASTGRYALVKLMERFNQVELPTIKLLDTRLANKEAKQKVMITQPMQQAIAAALQDKKQVIIFQNRRGYSPYQLCNVCGWIPHCQYCDVSLTFHKGRNRLKCHYCGTQYPVVSTCAACGSSNFQQKNFGTEKVEEQLVALFPQAKVARMDYDSVKGKNEHDTLIKQFENRQVDILVGTQMVVKGLDFEHVTLIGIVDGDGILSYSDFRVNERAYQLMEQVSGRAGRKHGQGYVLIQVTNLTHPVLGFVQGHDYQQLYNYELPTREQFFYPPFSKLIKITLSHVDKGTAGEAALAMAKALRETYGEFTYGPAEPNIERIRNKYLWELLVKLPRKNSLIQQCKKDLRRMAASLGSDRHFSRVQVIFDVDPI